MYEAEAKARQGTRNDLNKDIVAIVPQSEQAQPKARDQAASDFDTSPRYVQDARPEPQNRPLRLARLRPCTLALPSALPALLRPCCCPVEHI